ncbi:TetR/AcrR family transcriptional regulator [Knoellia sp. p5-6-4]|uniref:TetR/AcrR family transcriptional regulator n=1 Tax=unclassified Knoellia TaxID=2618719 RepID=UPI0023DA811B|nr:TetR/AcrR family transcriptional regulator [Knoellia sp. p5-6-4]MDF2146916.1 TetR/AcrR family transcriptional regulator [Knoellia sp. p5-6-4]
MSQPAVPDSAAPVAPAATRAGRAGRVGRGARMPRAQREEQILTVAEAVFAERGYQATTMEEVAERVGVTKPLIYGYFGSKEGLLSACVDRARAQLREATVAAWEAVPEDAPLEAVFESGIRAFFDFIDEHASAFALIQQEAAVAASASSDIERIRTQQSAVVAEALGRVPGLDGVPAELLEGYSEVVIGACERVAVWSLGRPGVTAQDATDLVMAGVWRGLAALAR